MTDDPESMLDAALHEYSNREPRPGLEHRVLRHIRTAPPARRPWRWAGWVPVTAALALILLHGDRTRVRQVPPINHATVSSAQPSLPIPSHGNHKVGSEPRKLEPFPEPEPLTPEERELLRFVESRPQQAREALAESAQIEELTIEPLKIEELP